MDSTDTWLMLNRGRLAAHGILALLMAGCALLGFQEEITLELTVYSIGNEQPVSGALVEINELADSAEIGIWHGGQTAGLHTGKVKYTSEEGLARFGGVKKGKVHIHVEVSGYKLYSEVFRADCSEKCTREVWLEPIPMGP
jgi:hypothetical protein